MGRAKGNMDYYRQDIRDIRKAYSLIKGFIEKSNWKAGKPVLLLDRLFQKTENHLNFASNRSITEAIFPPTDITDENEESGYPAKYAHRDKKKLEDFIEKNNDEYLRFLKSEGVEYQLIIQTKYIDKKVFYFLAVINIRSDNEKASGTTCIEYSVNELPEPKWWVKPFTKFVFDGWKKWVFILSPAAIFIFFVAGFYYYLQITPAPMYLLGYLSLVTLFTFIYYIAQPFYLTLDNSIAIVSERMLRISQRSGQVEMHYLDEVDNEGLPLREIRISIYSAECPICDGNVFIDNGKNEFKGRLIGKCRKAQTEHVFSFDHVTKKGYFLRLL